MTTLGIPKGSTKALGHDEYEEVLVSPSKECRHLYVSVTSHPVLLSFRRDEPDERPQDYGMPDDFVVGAGENHIFSDVLIEPNTTIMACNENAGDAYTKLILAVW